MNSPDKVKKIEKFTALQYELKRTLSKVPPGCANWFYQKAHDFKKVVKECDSFVKLKPTDDDTKRIKLENQLEKLKRYYV